MADKSGDFTTISTTSEDVIDGINGPCGIPTLQEGSIKAYGPVLYQYTIDTRDVVELLRLSATFATEIGMKSDQMAFATRIDWISWMP